MRKLLTIAEAAEVLGVSRRHIINLIDEAAASRKSRWRFGREIVDLSKHDATRRTIRINLNAVMPELEPQLKTPQPCAADCA